MTTDAQIQANRKNAKRSTGPRTAAGKLKSKANSLSHGLLVNSPTLPGEDTKLWEQHRDGFFSDFAPVGAIQQALVELLACLHWKIIRGLNYETSVCCSKFPGLDKSKVPALKQRDELEARLATAQYDLRAHPRRMELFDCFGQSNHTEVSGDDAYFFFDILVLANDLPFHDHHDPKFILAMGIKSKSDDVDPYDLKGWTTALLRKGADYLGGLAGRSGTALIEPARAHMLSDEAANKKQVREIPKTLQKLKPKIDEQLKEYFARHAIPTQELIDKIQRYLAPMHRKFTSVLHDLQRLQANMRGGKLSAPAALDVTVMGLPSDIPNSAVDHAPTQGVNRPLRQVG